MTSLFKLQFLLTSLFHSLSISSKRMNSQNQATGEDDIKEKMQIDVELFRRKYYRVIYLVTVDNP